MKTSHRKLPISKRKTLKDSTNKDFFSNKTSQLVYRIIGNDIVLQSFEIDKRTGQLFVKKGAILDVNHLNGESIVFSVEVSK